MPLSPFFFSRICTQAVVNTKRCQHTSRKENPRLNLDYSKDNFVRKMALRLGSLRGSPLRRTTVNGTRSNFNARSWRSTHTDSGSARSIPGQQWKAAGVLALASATTAYVFSRKTEPETPEIIPLPPIAEIETIEFQHPLSQNSWYWRMYFKTKRFLYLFAVFLPCVTLAAVVHVTESEKMRAYLLAHLVEALHSAGCGFQKFGQWLSMRPDLFPPDVIAVLSLFTYAMYIGHS